MEYGKGEETCLPLLTDLTRHGFSARAECSRAAEAEGAGN